MLNKWYYYLFVSLKPFVPFFPFTERCLGWEQGLLHYLEKPGLQQIALGLPRAQDTITPPQGPLSIWLFHI